MFFNFAVPLGNGIGFLVQAICAKFFDRHWEWGFRIIAILGLFLLVFYAIFVKEPERGEAEQAIRLPKNTLKYNLIRIVKK